MGVLVVLPVLMLSLLLAGGGGGGEKPRMVVLELARAGGVEPDMARAIAEHVTAEVEGRGYFQVLSTSDVEALLGVERQRQALGCADEASSCLTELAGALGARFVLSGSLSRLGDAYQLTLQVLDTNRAQAIGRSVRIARDLPTLVAQLPYAVAEASATPLPPPPSRVLPFSLMAAGAVSLLGGGALGLDAVSRDRSLHDELAAGANTPGRLRTVAEYEQLRGAIGRDRTVSLSAIGVGVALVGLGLLLQPPEVPAAAGAPRVTLAPAAAGAGLGLVGVLP